MYLYANLIKYLQQTSKLRKVQSCCFSGACTKTTHNKKKQLHINSELDTAVQANYFYHQQQILILFWLYFRLIFRSLVFKYSIIQQHNLILRITVYTHTPDIRQHGLISTFLRFPWMRCGMTLLTILMTSSCNTDSTERWIVSFCYSIV